MKFSDLHFDDAPKILVKPPGPRSREALETQAALESSTVAYPRGIPLAFDEAKGATMKDLDGNVYIDFFAGAGVLNVGHCNPEVLEAVKQQESKLIHTLDFPAKPRMELVRKLLEIAPGELKSGKVFFGGPTGSDAIEASVKLAKISTGRLGLLAFEGSYHGMTSGALSLTSGKKFKEKLMPLLAEAHFAPYAYCYRCVFGKDYPACGLQCATYVEHLLEDPHSGIVDPAAVVVEAIQGEGGSIVPPDEYVSELRRICTDYAVPLIIDEVQAGLGRTGKMFACEHSKVTPDMMTISKAIGGIGYPLSAGLCRKEFDTWTSGTHVGTFRGHLVSMAAGLAALKFMQRNDLPTYATELGRRMLRRLQEVQDETECVGEVRGRGLMIGIEFVKDKKTKVPAEEIAREVRKRCYMKGLIVELGGHYFNVIRFLPPLVLTEELADKGLMIFSEALRDAQRNVKA
jgi:diaminobutyrate-2-oxoglutarate transaminase